MEGDHPHRRRKKKVRRGKHGEDSDEDYVDGEDEYEELTRRRSQAKKKRRSKSKGRRADRSAASPISPSVDGDTTAIATRTTFPQEKQFDERLLRLFLGLDEKIRVPTGAWDFLAFKDLITCAAVSKTIRKEIMENVEYTRCRDGKDYLVRFPAFPGLLSTKQDLEVGAGLFPHQLASLQAMHRLENARSSFASLRGGVLGDAPGLGKTIVSIKVEWFSCQLVAFRMAVSRCSFLVIGADNVGIDLQHFRTTTCSSVRIF